MSPRSVFQIYERCSRLYGLIWLFSENGSITINRGQTLFEIDPIYTNTFLDLNSYNVLISSDENTYNFSSIKIENTGKVIATKNFNINGYAQSAFFEL